MGNAAWKVLDKRGDVIASPELQRAELRRKFLAAYNGAGSTRTTADWYSAAGSADETLLPERLTLIHRVDEALRNDPSFRGCLNKVVDSVVGPRGFTVKSQIDHRLLGLSDMQARDIEQGIDQVWGIWQDECDYSGNPARSMNFPTMLGLQYSTRLTRGETLTIPRYLKRPWARFHFCLQNVTPERIINPYGATGLYGLPGPASGKREDLRDGVKIGSRGEIQGIWVARRHPWSFRFTEDDWVTDYIPAVNSRTGRANFWHRFFPYRMEATRGEPAFAACLAGFKSLRDYIHDEQVRARMATMFGLAVFREDPFDAELESITDTSRLFGSTSEKSEKQVDWYSGQLNYLKPGDRVDVVNPNLPGPQFKDFIESVMTMSAAPLPLSREQVLNDFKGLSWSSGKIARDEAERATEREQDDVMCDYIVPVRERVIDEAVARGMIDLPGYGDPNKRRLYHSYLYFGPKRPYLEPTKEAQGAQLRMVNGTSTLDLECARLGQSMESVLLGHARELELRRRLGLAIPEHLERQEKVETGENEEDPRRNDDEEDQDDEKDKDDE